jgi:hypothetical protein
MFNFFSSSQKTEVLTLGETFKPGLTLLVKRLIQRLNTQHNDTQHNDTKHNDFRHSGTQHNVF